MIGFFLFAFEIAYAGLTIVYPTIGSIDTIRQLSAYSSPPPAEKSSTSPAEAKAPRSPYQSLLADLQKYLTYWITFGLLQSSRLVVSGVRIPLVFAPLALTLRLAQVVAVAWLILPQTQGASLLYATVDEFITHAQVEDKMLQMHQRLGETLARRQRVQGPTAVRKRVGFAGEPVGAQQQQQQPLSRPEETARKLGDEITATVTKVLGESKVE